MQRQRHPWDPVVLTSLPYILCAVVAPYPYSVIIAASSITTTVWHIEHEPMSLLFWIDYGFAFIWAYYDIVHLGIRGYILNMISITAHILTSRDPFRYERAHSIWHLFTCILAVYKVDLMWRLQKGEVINPLLTA